MAKPRLRIVPSRTEIGTVSPPRRKPNAELRTREYLTEPEIDRLLKAAKANRWGSRDTAMILIAYRHGLRAAELVDLRWDQVELGRNAVIHVRRVKNGTPSTHPLQGDEMRALRALMPDGRRQSPFVFITERGAPFTTAGFAKMVARAGVAAKFKFKVHPHMLRHADDPNRLCERNRPCRPAHRRAAQSAGWERHRLRRHRSLAGRQVA
jgi:type 1 fimbriae regulatory protein FimB/type 1 fimbriae regulatory protein FimE